MKWKITYYDRKVFEGISSLPIKIAARYIALTERMIQIGPNLGMPHTRAMGEGLFEIRLKGQEGIARVFYCTVKNEEIIVLHSFVKKTEKTPKNDLEIARLRLKEVKNHG